MTMIPIGMAPTTQDHEQRQDSDMKALNHRVDQLRGDLNNLEDRLPRAASAAYFDTVEMLGRTLIEQAHKGRNSLTYATTLEEVTTESDANDQTLTLYIGQSGEASFMTSKDGRPTPVNVPGVDPDALQEFVDTHEHSRLYMVNVYLDKSRVL